MSLHERLILLSRCSQHVQQILGRVQRKAANWDLNFYFLFFVFKEMSVKMCRWRLLDCTLCPLERTSGEKVPYPVKQG